AGRPVVLAAIRDGVEMRAGHDRRPGLPTGQDAPDIADRVDARLQSGLPEPAGDQVACARPVLVVDASEDAAARPRADGVQLVEQGLDARAVDLDRGRRVTHAAKYVILKAGARSG